MNITDPAGRITQAELARRLKVSRGAVSKAVKSGRIVPDDEGLFDPVEAEIQWLENTRQSAKGGPSSTKAEKGGRQSNFAGLRMPALPGKTLSKLWLAGWKTYQVG